jgi:hypothetical protein
MACPEHKPHAQWIQLCEQASASNPMTQNASVKEKEKEKADV